MGSELAHQIGRCIATGHYAPGSLIEDESALVSRYGVSRTVVRDAVKVLVGKGLLEVRRGIGTRVKPREQWALFDLDVLAWQLSAQADPTMLLQLMEIRQLFEPQAAAWAAKRATASDIAEILSALEAMSADVANMELFLKADARFHRAVLRAAHNEYLFALSGIIYSSLLSIIRLHNPDVGNNRRIVSFHRDVHDAIAAGNEVDASLKMAFLIEDASSRIKASTALAS
ncbi:FadR/GntR family transcriptional regulator [Granulosicoccus antarcticus]|nr:FadR/GntR family transcriptional regulator [Granulosicoccus antarcticus]